MNKRVETGGNTFIIDVKSAEGGSFKGTITWVQTQEKVAFRSPLELLRLMDSAVRKEEANA